MERKKPIFLDEAIKSDEEIGEDLLIHSPAPRGDFETKILAKDKVDTFASALDEKDRQILQMRMDGCSLETVALLSQHKGDNI